MGGTPIAFTSTMNRRMLFTLLTLLLLTPRAQASMACSVVAENHDSINLAPLYETAHVDRPSVSSLPIIAEAFRQQGADVKILETLGFRYDQENNEVETPTLADLNRKLKARYTQAGIAEEDWILSTGYFVFRSTESSTMRFGLLSADTPMKLAPDKWRASIMPATNIRTADFVSVIARGMLPAGRGMHDAYHALVFYRDPQLMRSAKHANQKWLELNLDARYMYRHSVYMEDLALPNKQLATEISSALAFKPTARTAMTDVAQFFKAMPEDKFQQHASKLAAAYESYFTNFGGAVAHMPEREEMLEKRESITAQTMLEGFDPTLKAVVNGHQNPISLARQLIAIKKLRAQNQDVEALERLTVARMEFALWKGLAITPSEVPTELMNESLEAHGPFLNYLQDLFDTKI